MNIYVAHDAGMLARLTNAGPIAGDEIWIRKNDPGAVFGSAYWGNPLASDWLLDLESPGRFIISWSGTLAANDSESDPRTWGPVGQRSLRELCAALTPQLERVERIMCFRPHARHVLSDIPSCLTFVREQAGRPYSIALAPSSMFVPSMLDQADEHLERHFVALGAVCAAVYISDVAIEQTDNDTRCVEVPLGQGLLTCEALSKLIRDHVPSDTPVVISARDGAQSVEQQLECLGG